ncbi:MAG: hypothetical protein JJW01_00165 [Alphaproteobacteria bacterium]|nr:hypothetical protein [Rickettsiales bacterium]
MSSINEEIVKKLGTERGINNINSQQDINKEFIKFKIYENFSKDERLKIANTIILFIKEQNKNDLCQYVIRRQIEVELLNEFIKNNAIEVYIHNLIFQQKTDNKNNSEHNLWMINEDFANYDYIASDIPLKNIKYKNELIFANDIENKDILKKCGITQDNLNNKRPDMLIFHKLGSIVIVDFKKPDKHCFEYINQIQGYAKLIANKSNKKIKSFFAYIIGESLGIPNDDYSQTSDSEGYFRQGVPIKDFENINQIGSVYMEISKYTRLQKLAKLRNSNFAKKLLNIENIETIVNNIVKQR